MWRANLLAVLLTVCLSSVHVRPETKVQEVHIQLGEEGELDFPDFYFKDIYSRQIW
jgi:hypothetical protein